MRTRRFRNIHPLTATAAVSLTLFSLLGIASLTGMVDLSGKDFLAEDETSQLASANTTEAPEAAARLDPGLVHPAPPVRSRVVAADSRGGDESCSHCGEVAAINLVKLNGAAHDLYSYAGGISDGVVGNEIDTDDGNVLMTILGAGRGAYAGHSIEQKTRPVVSYMVKVQMSDGSKRTVMMADKPSFEVGDEVKVINGGVSVIS